MNNIIVVRMTRIAIHVANRSAQWVHHLLKEMYKRSSQDALLDDSIGDSHDTEIGYSK